MHIVKCLLVCLVVILWLKPVAQPVFSYVKDFDVKSGYIEYSNNYDEAESIIKFWWADYGQKYREEFITQGRIKSINLSDGSYFYTINMQTRQGSKVEADVAGQVQEYYAQMHYTNERGVETILGYDCYISERAGVVTSTYKGVPLRVAEGSGCIVQDAIRFKEDAIVGPEIFLLPSNVIIEDATEDLRSEMDPKYGSEDEFFEQPLEVGISFDQFVELCTNICRKLKNEDISAYALEDSYYINCGNDAEDFENAISIQIKELSHYSFDSNWTPGEGRELFYHKQQRSVYNSYIGYDEELGTKFPVSFLIVEMVKENFILEIETFSEKSKEEMIELFEKFNLYLNEKIDYQEVENDSSGLYEQFVEKIRTLNIPGFSGLPEIDQYPDGSGYTASFMKDGEGSNIMLVERPPKPDWWGEPYKLDGKDAQYIDHGGLSTITIDLTEIQSMLIISSTTILDKATLEQIARQTGLMQISPVSAP
jgi:hypothetical protein